MSLRTIASQLEPPPLLSSLRSVDWSRIFVGGAGYSFMRLALGIAVVILGGVHNQIHAEQPSIEVRLSRTSVQIVDPVELQIIVIAPRGSEVTFQLPADKLGEFDVLASKVLRELPIAQSDDIGDTRQWIATLQIETIYSGKQELPVIAASVTLPNGNIVELSTDPTSITVQSSAEPNEEISTLRDLKSVVDVALPTQEPSKWQRWLWIPGGLLIAFVTLAIWKTRKPVSRQQWALRQLSLLGRTDNEDIEEKISQAVHIVQSYASYAYNIQESDTEELRKQIPSLDKLLKQTEEIRFAKRKLAGKDVSELLELAQQTVESFPTEHSSSHKLPAGGTS